MGILRLAEKYGSERLNAAASVALASSLLTYKSVSAILKNGVDMEPGLESPQDKPPINHENVRGADYYRQSEEVLNA